ncbi:MAG: hypothetical protein ACHQ3O_08545 [Candidatus Limnocylindria bacterium]
MPTHAVPNLASGAEQGPRAAAGRGFRSLLPRAALPPGDYRIGVLVERSDGAWMTFHGDRLAVPGGS